MPTESSFIADVLKLDCDKEMTKITDTIRKIVLKQFRKRGVVVALSGGVDSSVVGALCARALGKERVLGLRSPQESYSQYP